MVKCSACGKEFTNGEEFIGLVQYRAKDIIDPDTSQIINAVEQTQEMIYFHVDCLDVQ